MSLTIASWNVNSIKVRLDHVLDWLHQNPVDILALQEIKCLDEHFPFEPFIDAGFELVVSGQKTYNGVAVLSRRDADEIITDIPGFSDDERRLLAVTVDGIRIYNVYVPNGQSVDSEKYQYKLEWLSAFTAFVEQEQKTYDKQIILGDFNIAPEDIDVYDVTAWHESVLVSTKERNALQSLLALGFYDSFRLFSDDKHCYSWWDYRGGHFQKGEGLRIDLILVNQMVKTLATEATIDKTPRHWPRPSDHCPVLLTL